jgi:F-box-like
MGTITYLDGVGLIFQQATIGSLPDNVLLDIFDFYQLDAEHNQLWYVLVYVCRRWQDVVFGSPRRLDLRLFCDDKTTVREMLDVWPPLPIIIRESGPLLSDGDNIIAALEHHDRVCEIDLWDLTSFELEQLSAVMQEPFPALTDLKLEVPDDLPAVLPDTFLGGSAPRLRSLHLLGIPFPALPKLLLSSLDLVNVRLSLIPHTGYFSPEAMVTCLSALTKLESLGIGFESPASRPDRRHRHPPPLTRVVLPALTHLEFHGVSEYFEDLVAWIDTPAIRFINTRFFNQLSFDIPQYFQFVGRTGVLGSFERLGAKLSFELDAATISLHHLDQPEGMNSFEDEEHPLRIHISCGTLDWQVSGLAQICSQFSPFFSSVEQIDINGKDIPSPDWEDDMDHMQWPELFHPFTAVQSLHVALRLDAPIAKALQELTGDRVMEVLPALRHLSSPSWQFGEYVGSMRKTYEPFITARQLINRPVSTH